MGKKRLKPPEILPAPIDEIAPSSLPDDGFVRGSSKDEVKATNSQGMKLWLYSPAKVLLLTEPTRKLAEVARLRGMPNRTIETVDVVLHAPTRRLFVYPPDEEVDDAFDVTYRNEGTQAEFNIRSLLQQYGLEVTRGWREQYDVKLDQNSDLGPALVFQLTTNPVRERVGGKQQDVTEQEGTDSAAPKAQPKRKASAKASSAESGAKAKSAGKATSRRSKAKAESKEQDAGTGPGEESEAPEEI